MKEEGKMLKELKSVLLDKKGNPRCLACGKSWKKLNKEKYDNLLSYYYEKRGWDNRGIPTKATMKKLGLEKEAEALDKVVKLK